MLATEANGLRAKACEREGPIKAEEQNIPPRQVLYSYPNIEITSPFHPVPVRPWGGRFREIR